MSDFKTKMLKIRFLLGFRTRPRWESLQRFLAVFLRRGGKGREEEEKGGKRRGQAPPNILA